MDTDLHRLRWSSGRPRRPKKTRGLRDVFDAVNDGGDVAVRVEYGTVDRTPAAFDETAAVCRKSCFPAKGYRDC